MSTSIKTFIFIILINTLVISCGLQDSNIDKLENLIQNAENNIELFDEAQNQEIDNLINEINQEIQTDKNTYTSEEITKYNKLIGRYNAILFKNGIKDINESIKQFGNQLDGLIDGFNDVNDNND
jgi:hypothetical protein